MSDHMDPDPLQKCHLIPCLESGPLAMLMDDSRAIFASTPPRKIPSTADIIDELAQKYGDLLTDEMLSEPAEEDYAGQGKTALLRLMKQFWELPSGDQHDAAVKALMDSLRPDHPPPELVVPRDLFAEVVAPVQMAHAHMPGPSASRQQFTPRTPKRQQPQWAKVPKTENRRRK